MKRTYETPMVEKLAFCYRDQVVAASGGVAGSSSDIGGTSGGSSSAEQIIGQIAEGLNINGCADYECSSLADIF